MSRIAIIINGRIVHADGPAAAADAVAKAIHARTHEGGTVILIGDAFKIEDIYSVITPDDFCNRGQTTFS